jgi:AraC family L-rhamnose operon regulatory protein RhaS
MGVDTFSTSGSIAGGVIRILPICVREDGDFFASERFVLIIFSGSPAVVKVSGNNNSAIAPGCLCFSESERAELLSSDLDKMVRIFFHPQVVNSVFTFENVYGDRSKLTITERQDRDFLDPFIVRTQNYFGYLPLGPATYETLARLLRMLRGELLDRQDGFWPCRSRSYFYEILFLLFGLYRDGGVAHSVIADDSLAGKVMHFIHCNYSQKLLVDDLCKRFCTNKTTLNKAFNSLSGGPLLNYLNKVRINTACLLLRDTKLPVQEIVYRTGFNDIAHFGRMFKRIVRMNPGEYRREHTQRRIGDVFPAKVSSHSSRLLAPKRSPIWP